ncbi:WD40 repeat-like protein [Gigaspora margarita]|uniref:WD40 repeat-like protein n=1 Tax=Gigaspora margarita TaxID=4874 RepID=A0A8H4AD70_GIGMA|nr:WD40 repeat-like protein [Gigaspora margarita]
MPQRLPNYYRRELQDDRSLPLQHISFPPATVQAGQLSVNNTPTTLPTVSTAQNVNPPLPTTSALPQSPTTPLAAFTTCPLTAPAATGSQQPDYFSGSHHNSPTSPTGPSGNLTPPASTALINQTSSSSGSSSSIFGRFKLTSVRSKISKTPNTETKPESSGMSVSTENNADTKTDSKPSAPTQSQDESSAQVRKDEESKNKIALKESVKIGFILKPHEGSELEELPSGNSRLTANRILRARKILSYVVEKLELDSSGGGERDEIVTEKTLIEKDEEKTTNSINLKCGWNWSV